MMQHHLRANSEPFSSAGRAPPAASASGPIRPAAQATSGRGGGDRKRGREPAWSRKSAMALAGSSHPAYSKSTKARVPHVLEPGCCGSRSRRGRRSARPAGSSVSRSRPSPAHRPRRSSAGPADPANGGRGRRPGPGRRGRCCWPARSRARASGAARRWRSGPGPAEGGLGGLGPSPAAAGGKSRPRLRATERSPPPPRPGPGPRCRTGAGGGCRGNGCAGRGRRRRRGPAGAARHIDAGGGGVGQQPPFGVEAVAAAGAAVAELPLLMRRTVMPSARTTNTRLLPLAGAGPNSPVSPPGRAP